MQRTDIWFSSSRDRIGAWLYLPADTVGAYEGGSVAPADVTVRHEGTAR
jgi:hypothetical protein